MASAALKINASIAQPFVIAGSPFSITTTIENAHEEAVEIVQFFYHIPHQVQWIHEGEYQAQWAKYAQLPFYRRPLNKSSTWRSALRAPGQTMYYGDPTLKAPQFTVLPGETCSYSFGALVPRWLLSSGGELAFPGTVNYIYKGQNHAAEFKVRFTLRPPLVSNSIGATLGSLAGTVARGLREQGPAFFPDIGIAFVASTALSIILSVVAVIYSSRRTGDAQPIITVEDFWGGLLVGFMIGYLGHEFFARIVPLK